MLKNVFFSLLSVYKVDQWSPTLIHEVSVLPLFPPGLSLKYTKKSVEKVRVKHIHKEDLNAQLNDHKGHWATKVI